MSEPLNDAEREELEDLRRKDRLHAGGDRPSSPPAEDIRRLMELERRDALAPASDPSRPIWELVIEDMQERDREGRRRYGVPLRAHNGRDALQDAYEEALDLAVYLKQALVERGART